MPKRPAWHGWPTVDACSSWAWGRPGSHPLAATGLEVHGIELDPEMIDQLRAKPGSERVNVHHGDMADMKVDGSFDLIYALFGTLFVLPTQADQVRCFRRAAQKLTVGGKRLPRPSTPASRPRSRLLTGARVHRAA